MLASTSYQQTFAGASVRDAAPKNSPVIPSCCSTSILRRDLRRVSYATLRTQKGQLSERLQAGKVKHRARLRNRLVAVFLNDGALFVIFGIALFVLRQEISNVNIQPSLVCLKYSVLLRGFCYEKQS